MTAVRVQQDSPRRADAAVSATDMLNTSHGSNGGGDGPSPDESGGATIRLTESLLAASQRRSIFPMRYQNSDQSSMEEGGLFDEDILTASPQCASLFPTAIHGTCSTNCKPSSSISFRLPVQPLQTITLPKEADGYTHSFYDLKETTTRTRRMESPPPQVEREEPPKPFWEHLIRLLPWVKDDDYEQEDTTRMINSSAVMMLQDGDHQKIPPALAHPLNGMVSRTTGRECVPTTEDETKDHGTKHNERTAAVLPQPPPPRRPSSILRRSRFSCERMATLDQVPPPQTTTGADASGITCPMEADMPSLSSASDSDSSVASSVSSQGMSTSPLTRTTMAPLPRPARRCISAPCGLAKPRATFDPRISVRQFNRSQEELKSTWFSADELGSFRREALQRIVQFQRRGSLTPTSGGVQRAIFSHQALGLDNINTNEQSVHNQNELVIQNVLIVDAHDICANLFAKGLLALFPNARIVKAKTAEEAVKHMQLIRFDMILVEERLKMFHRCQNVEPAASGSCLLQTSVQNKDKTLLVGVSAHLAEDAPKLRAAGADILWSKPPPLMDHDLRKSLIQTLLAKRRGKRP